MKAGFFCPPDGFRARWVETEPVLQYMEDVLKTGDKRKLLLVGSVVWRLQPLRKLKLRL